MPQLELSPRERMLAALRREQAALDELIAETELGPRNQRHVDELADRAAAIGTNIRNAYRVATPPTVKIVAGKSGGIWA